MAYNYQNPYTMYPAAAYQQTYAQQPNQYTQPAQSGTSHPVGLIWVDGEVGAKAYQMPAGWTPNTPLPLWDTNDTVIYLKSVNPMGMPNPLQKIHYELEPQKGTPMPMQSAQQGMLPSGETRSDYVTREDLERVKDELRSAISEATAIKKGGRNNESSV